MRNRSRSVVVRANVDNRAPVGLYSRIFKSDSGQAISEYLVILGVIVVACILLAVAFQAELSSLWGNVTSSMGAIG